MDFKRFWEISEQLQIKGSLWLHVAAVLLSDDLWRYRLMLVYDIPFDKWCRAQFILHRGEGNREL